MVLASVRQVLLEWLYELHTCTHNVSLAGLLDSAPHHTGAHGSSSSNTHAHRDKMVDHLQVCDKMVDLINGGSGFDKMVDHLQVCDLLLPCVSKLVRILSLPCCCFVFYNRGLCPISELL